MNIDLKAIRERTENFRTWLSDQDIGSCHDAGLLTPILQDMDALIARVKELEAVLEPFTDKNKIAMASGSKARFGSAGASMAYGEMHTLACKAMGRTP